nr:sulfite exporter TauE/SafE family protein [Salinibacterium sp. ZJ77]
MRQDGRVTDTRAPYAALIGIGILAGFASGLFGVGGGVLIVPGLVLLAHFEHKRATGTSLVAIVPIAITAMVSYLVAGNVVWEVALPIAVGMIVGGAIGSWLLARLPTTAIAWAFIVVLVVVAIQLLLDEPARGAQVTVGAVEILLFGLFGLAAGIVSGLVGVGGGIIIVPALQVGWGLSDLVAKGASLVAIVPSAVITSVQNHRRGHTDIRSGLIVGVAGAVTSVLGAWVANVIDARAGSIVFGVFLLLVAAQMVQKRLAARGKRE